MVVSYKRESMLRYETITLIQHVEVHDLSIDLVSFIWVVTSNCSYTPPNFVPLLHNFFSYESECTNIRSNDTEDLWSETKTKPIETLLIVPLCGVDFGD
jgi:hypothetical protein